jgi:ligand-binding SRPBCC domain-containing protein
MRLSLLDPPDRLGPGVCVSLRIAPFLVPIEWKIEVIDWRPPHTFTDVQVEGPFQLWEHTHELVAAPGGTEVRDLIRYRLPGGVVVRSLGAVVNRPVLRSLLAYRTRALLELAGAP